MAKNRTNGTKIKLSIASVFTDIAQVTRIKQGKRERGEVETTDLDSTWEESLPSAIAKGGEPEFTIQYDPDSATHAALNTSFANKVVEAWKVVFPTPTNTEYAFSAWIKSIEEGEQTPEGLQTATISLKITGAVAVTP